MFSDLSDLSNSDESHEYSSESQQFSKTKETKETKEISINKHIHDEPDPRDLIDEKSLHSYYNILEKGCDDPRDSEIIAEMMRDLCPHHEIDPKYHELNKKFMERNGWKDITFGIEFYDGMITRDIFEKYMLSHSDILIGCLDEKIKEIEKTRKIEKTKNSGDIEKFEESNKIEKTRKIEKTKNSGDIEKFSSSEIISLLVRSCLCKFQKGYSRSSVRGRWYLYNESSIIRSFSETSRCMIAELNNTHYGCNRDSDFLICELRNMRKNYLMCERIRHEKPDQWKLILEIVAKMNNIIEKYDKFELE